VPDEVSYELQTALFANCLAATGVSLPCDDCRGDLGCGEPAALTKTGALSRRPDDIDAVVRWPSCPGRYRALYRLGGDVLPLSAIVEWFVELGYHRRAIGGGACRVYREFLRLRGVPEKMREAQILDEAHR
jgi:hypothetical protein